MLLLVQLSASLQMSCRFVSSEAKPLCAISPSAFVIKHRLTPFVVMQSDDVPPVEEEDEEELNLTAKEKAQLMMRDPIFLVGLGVIGAALFGSS